MNILKISFLLFFMIPTVIIANDEYLDVNYFDINSYEIEPEESEFDSDFSSESDRKDFKKLREFLNEKRDLENYISMEIDDFHYYKLREGIVDYDKIIFKLKKIIKIVTTDSIELNMSEYEKYFKDQNSDDWGYYEEAWDKDEIMKLSKDDIQKRITLLDSRIAKCKKIEKALSDDLKNVRSDVYKCQNQIDYALAPEYERQKFRKAISGYFSLLIGFLLGAFFLVVYLKSNNNLSSQLLSGNGLQFITLFVLIIAIILFGILGILEGRELAAILSGISGYILGKGTTPPPTTT